MREIIGTADDFIEELLKELKKPESERESLIWNEIPAKAPFIFWNRDFYKKQLVELEQLLRERRLSTSLRIITGNYTPFHQLPEKYRRIYEETKRDYLKSKGDD